MSNKVRSDIDWYIGKRGSGMSFFAADMGLNADLERHRMKEHELRSAILRLSSIDDRSDMDEACLVSYTNSLDILLQSKVALVEQIGRKK